MDRSAKSSLGVFQNLLTYLELFRMSKVRSQYEKYVGVHQGLPQGGGGRSPRNQKIVVEKWCYFPELYKVTKVLEDRIEKG